METDSSQKTASSHAFIEGRIARCDGPRLTQVRFHCAPDVTAHSFNMLLQQCAKEQKWSAISRKHSTTAGSTLCTNWHNAAAKVHVTIQNGHRHNASPLRAQNLHRAATRDRATTLHGYQS